MLGEQVLNHIQKLKQTHFKLGNKPDKLLARQLKGVQAERAIHRVSSLSGQTITEPSLINNRFYQYYAQLYVSKSNAPDIEIAYFLSSLDFPTLSETSKHVFTLEEIKSDIHSFPNGKACVCGLKFNFIKLI